MLAVDRIFLISSRLHTCHKETSVRFGRSRAIRCANGASEIVSAPGPTYRVGRYPGPAIAAGRKEPSGYFLASAKVVGQPSAWRALEPGTAPRSKWRPRIRRWCGRWRISRAGYIQDGLARPAVGVGIQIDQTLVRFQVGLEIRQMHVVVAVCQKRVAQRIEDSRLMAVEMTGEDQVQCRPRFRLVIIVPVRVVPAPARRPPVPRSGRTGRSSLRPLARPFRWSRRRACQWSAPRSS